MRLFFLLGIIALLSGCELWFDNVNKQGDVELYLSTVPRAEVSDTFLTITKAELQHNAGQWHELTLEKDLSQRNLQRIHITKPLRIANAKNIPKGRYTTLRLTFPVPAGRSVRRDTGGTFNTTISSTVEIPITPEFSIAKGETSSLLLPLDFQKNLAFYEDEYDIHYEIEASQLSAIAMEAGRISGRISENALNNLNCESTTLTTNNEREGAYVYLYKDSGQSLDTLADIMLGAQESPVATAAIKATDEGNTYEYHFAPQPQGDYVLALTCDGLKDHPLYKNTTVKLSEGIRVKVPARGETTVNIN